MQRKKIIIFGATGSIGLSAINIVENYNDHFEIVGLSAHSNEFKMSEICKKFQPKIILFSNVDLEKTFNKSNFNKETKILFGPDSFSELLNLDFDLLINGISGFSGMLPTYYAIDKGKDVAIANKESLVTAGKLLLEKAKFTGSKVIPIDSEHNALSQILNKYNINEIEKVILTASGGPFRSDSKEMLAKRNLEEALNHPTWKMGPKNTIDSATLMNKALEVIEASVLFSMASEKIEVLVHPESIVHGMVSLIDGGVISYLSQTDMRVPIFNAMNFPNTCKHFISHPNFTQLNFNELNEETFPSVSLARLALKKGFIATTFFNASNEIAVDYFLRKKIHFTDIFIIVEKTLHSANAGDPKSIEEVFEYDRFARKLAESEINKLGKK